MAGDGTEPEHPESGHDGAPDAEPPASDLSPAADGIDGPGRVDLTKHSVPDSARASSQRRGPLRSRRRPAKPKRKAPWWEIPALIVAAIVIAILVKTFLVQPFYIPSGSMENTLHINDRILVNKIVYDFRDPHPGDIVVFNAPRGWDDEPANTPPSNPVLRAIRGFGQLIGFTPPDGEVLVKRVIAVGGQTVRGFADGRVQVRDGTQGSWRTLNEPFIYNSGGMSLGPGFGPVTVPKGRLWVMGDHRNDSEDSRFHCSADGQAGDSMTSACSRYAQEATVPISDVIGKAFVIAWPPSRWGTLGTPSNFEGNTASALVTPNAVPFLSLVPLLVLRRRSRRRRQIR